MVGWQETSRYLDKRLGDHYRKTTMIFESREWLLLSRQHPLFAEEVKDFKKCIADAAMIAHGIVMWGEAIHNREYYTYETWFHELNDALHSAAMTLYADNIPAGGLETIRRMRAALEGDSAGALDLLRSIRSELAESDVLHWRKNNRQSVIKRIDVVLSKSKKVTKTYRQGLKESLALCLETVYPFGKSATMTAAKMCADKIQKVLDEIGGEE